MLDNLLPDIVSQIAAYLSYEDLVAFRKALTCGDLRDATNTHDVWLNLATRYLSENPGSHFSKIKSLSSLTTDQLRQRFEKRLVVNDIWRLSGDIYPSIKRLQVPPTPLSFIKIAPGGRWAFGGTVNCTILYYWDLESNNPKPRALEPPNDGNNNTPASAFSTIVAIDFAVESGDPLSGFLIAFVGGRSDWHRYYHRPSHSREWLYIWDVIPQIDGTLRAKHLKTIPLPSDGWDSRLSFNEYLAARSTQGRVDVYRWKDCTEMHLIRCTLIFGDTPHSLYVLSNDKLLVYSNIDQAYGVRLFALKPEHSEVAKYMECVPLAIKVWSFAFDCKNDGSEISRPYFDGTNYRQSIASLNGVLSLTIPASNVNRATLDKVSDFDRYQQGSNVEVYGIALKKGYCRTDNWLYRFGFKGGIIEEDYENGAIVDSRILHILETLQRPSSFDDELGRTVSIARNLKHVILQDFSRPLYTLSDVCPDPDKFLDTDPED